jgi:hypothetical protein
MSETRIDFIRQGYPLWVPVAPRKLPWLPPSEGEGIWRAKLADLTEEAMADSHALCTGNSTKQLPSGSR